jgi:hypothetical protein
MQANQSNNKPMTSMKKFVIREAETIKTTAPARYN